MASAGDRLLDEAVLHRIALSRYSTATVRKVLALLNRTDTALAERILRADNEGRDPAQLEKLLEEIKALQADGWTVVRGRMNDDVAALANVERLFSERMVRAGAQASGAAVANAPTTAQVVAAVNARPFQGRFLRDWLSDAEAGAAKRVRDTLRQGFVEGRSVTDLVRQIRGTRANGYRDGVLEISRRGAEAMVRTALTHTAAVSAKETYEAMGVEAATFLAVLDSRTTLTCAGLNGQTFPLDKFPWPPRHINCRSTAMPVVKGASKVEAPSYSDWLKRQPDEVQNDILGPARAKLFRSGKLTVDRFTDDKGRLLTLDELRHQAGLRPELRVPSAIGPLSPAETAALTSYTGDGYRAINGALRGQRPFSADVKDEIAALDNLFGRSALPSPAVLYRGVGPEVVEAYRRAGLKAGSVIFDPAFMSTSLSRAAATEFLKDQPDGYFIRLTAPAGSRALSVEKVAFYGEGEREILLARGQRLKVIGYDRDTRTINAELLRYQAP